MVVLSGFILYYIFDKLDYKSVSKKVKTIGGLRGVYKGIGLVRVIGILFVVFLVLIPNSYLALEAGIPAESHWDYFGEESRPFYALSL